MRDFGYNIEWATYSIDKILKYIPEWNLGTQIDTYFVQDPLDSNNNVAYAEMMQKYETACQELANIYNDIGGLIGQYGDSTNTEGLYVTNFNIVTGPVDAGNSGYKPEWESLNEFTRGWLYAWNVSTGVGPQTIPYPSGPESG